MKKINVVVAVVLMVLGFLAVNPSDKAEAAKHNSSSNTIVYADMNGGIAEYDSPSHKSSYTIEEAGLFKVNKTVKHGSKKWYRLSDGKWIQAKFTTKVKDVSKKKISKKTLKKAKTYSFRVGDVTYFYKLVMYKHKLGIYFEGAVC